MLAATEHLSRQNYVCCRKMFCPDKHKLVATKMILLAAPANDTQLHFCWQCHPICDVQHSLVRDSAGSKTHTHSYKHTHTYKCTQALLSTAFLLTIIIMVIIVMMMMMMMTRCTGLNCMFPSREVRCLANNNNEYLERLTRTGPKRLHVLYKHILSKFSAYNMNARTHARTHTQTQPDVQASRTCFQGSGGGKGSDPHVQNLHREHTSHSSVQFSSR